MFNKNIVRPEFRSEKSIGELQHIKQDCQQRLREGPRRLREENAEEYRIRSAIWYRDMWNFLSAVHYQIRVLRYETERRNAA